MKSNSNNFGKKYWTTAKESKSFGIEANASEWNRNENNNNGIRVNWHPEAVRRWRQTWIIEKINDWWRTMIRTRSLWNSFAKMPGGEMIFMRDLTDDLEGKKSFWISLRRQKGKIRKISQE